MELWRDPPANTVADNKCDTNADMCCRWKNFLATYCAADVYAYDASIKPIENVPRVTGATAFDDPVSGDTFIILFHESFYYGEKLDHSLINPNQIRYYGIPLWDHPFDPMHSLSVEAHPNLHIPLRSTGTKISLCTRVPTLDELRLCEHISMTNPQRRNPSEIIMV